MTSSENVRLKTPSYPEPVHKEELAAAIRATAKVLADLKPGYAVAALTAVEAIAGLGHSHRSTEWAIFRLAELRALAVHPRDNLDVVQETVGTSICHFDDPRPRYLDGRLIPNGPYPLAVNEPADWCFVQIEPVHAKLDEVLEGKFSDMLSSANLTEGEGKSDFSANPSSESAPLSQELALLEQLTPNFNRHDGQWLSCKRAAAKEGLETRTLAQYRSKGLRNASKTLGRDQQGRVWRRVGTPNSHPWYLRNTLVSEQNRR